MYKRQAEPSDPEVKREADAAAQLMSKGTGVAADSVIAATTLGGGSGLWIIYTASGKEVGTEINRLLHDLKKSDYRVRLTKDPDWSLLSRYVSEWQTKQ